MSDKRVNEPSKKRTIWKVVVFLALLFGLLTLLVWKIHYSRTEFTELLKAIPWWVLFASIVLAVYHDKIGQLIDRIKSFEAKGVKVLLEERANAQEQTPNNRKAKNVAKRVADDKKKSPRQSKRTATPSREEILKVEVEFERLYNAILGGQLEILKHLNTVKFPVHVQTLLNFYDGARRTYRALYLSFDQYLNFLTHNRLVEKVDGDKYKITEKGSLFLSYIASRGYPLVKAL